jgi:hypothetical protein
MISTKNLTQLLEPPALRKITKALAMLDAIIEPEWEYRYFSFNSKWSESEEMASMRNGSGDGWYCVFSSTGIFLKGFDHESEMSPWNREQKSVWPGVLDNVPAVFEPCAAEPAFSMGDTTYCIWRENSESQWRIGNISFRVSAAAFVAPCILAACTIVLGFIMRRRFFKLTTEALPYDPRKAPVLSSTLTDLHAPDNARPIKC